MPRVLSGPEGLTIIISRAEEVSQGFGPGCCHRGESRSRARDPADTSIQRDLDRSAGGNRSELLRVEDPDAAIAGLDEILVA